MKTDAANLEALRTEYTRLSTVYRSAAGGAGASALNRKVRAQLAAEGVTAPTPADFVRVGAAIVDAVGRTVTGPPRDLRTALRLYR